MRKLILGSTLDGRGTKGIPNEEELF